MRNLALDIRYAMRMWLKRPGFTVVVVTVLALCIGANTAMFSVINAVLLRPLSLREQDRLVVLWERTRQMEDMSVAYPNFLDWQAQGRSFEQLAGFKTDNFNYTDGGDPERVPGKQVTANFFSTLGVEPVLGRTFTPEEDRPGAAPTVLVGYNFWKRRFASDPGLLDKQLMLNGRAYTAIGVLPADFNLYGEGELYTPLGLNADKMTDRAAHSGLYAIGRLRPGASVEGARTEMEALAANLARQYPESNEGNSVAVVSLPEDIVGDYRKSFLTLLGAVALVLLIACANVANLLLAAGAARQQEMAVRAATGASRWRLMRQLFAESTTLSVAGGLAGLVLAWAGIKWLMSLAPPDVPRTKEVGIDLWVLGFTALIAVLTGIVFGLAPSVQISKTDLNTTLKEAGRGSMMAPGSRRMRNALVTVEIALALILLVGAGLMVKSFLRLRATAPGFDANNVLTMRLSLPPTKYTERQQYVQFTDRVLEEVKALPGVRAAAISGGLPLGRGGETSYTIEGRPPDMEAGQQPMVVEYPASSDYFRTMGIPLIKGRYFNDGDREGSPKVVVIDARLAQKAFAGEDPIGRRLIPSGDEPHEIVGIVGDVKHYGLDREAKEQIYYPFAQRGGANLYLSVRTVQDPASAGPAVRGRIAAIDRDQPVYDVKTMQERVAQSIAKPRFNTLLLAIFAGMALLLTVVGTYGVISYTVAQRTNEIGIRLALGARPSHIKRMVLRQGLLLVFVGLAVGLVVAYAINQIMASLVYGVSTTDPFIFAGAALFLTAVTLLASYVPARRATQVDPVIALRNQ
jgi:putative ABC transport system permease protein